MKNLLKKTFEFLSGAKVYSNHTAIKGNKSGGSADVTSGYKHWKDGTATGDYDKVN